MTYSELPAQVIHQKCPLKGISEAGNSDIHLVIIIIFIVIVNNFGGSLHVLGQSRQGK